MQSPWHQRPNGGTQACSSHQHVVPTMAQRNRKPIATNVQDSMYIATGHLHATLIWPCCALPQRNAPGHDLVAHATTVHPILAHGAGTSAQVCCCLCKRRLPCLRMLSANKWRSLSPQCVWKTPTITICCLRTVLTKLAAPVMPWWCNHERKL